MRSPFLFVLLLSAFVWLPPAAAESDATRELQRLVKKNGGFGGGVLRISDGKSPALEAAAGMARPGVPMTPQTPFEIASITKTVTAAAVLRLVEMDRLSLATPLGEILPAEEVAGFSPDLTVQQLLLHRSGLPDYWQTKPKGGGPSFLSEFLAAPHRDWSAGDILAHARRLPPKPAGRRFHYSDTNYVLLGRIIEHITGQPLHTAYQRLIFEPLGMTSTWLTYREKGNDRSLSDRYEGRENLRGVPRQSADWAGGGLASTAHDLERFLRGLQSGLFRSPRTWALMRQTLPTGERGLSYGLGLYRIELDDSLGELWGHDGHGNAFAYFWPQRNITFTGTLNQTENDWWPLVENYLPSPD